MSRHHDRTTHTGHVANAVMAEATRPTDEQIRSRAYEKFRNRNGEPGDAVTDWLQAERELVAERTAAVSKH